MKLQLVRLSEKYRRHLTEMMDEWLSVETKSEVTPGSIVQHDYRDFDGYLSSLDDTQGGKYVEATTFFCLDEEADRFVGAANIRHRLNDSLLAKGGHIGDGVRPSLRGRGIGTELVRLALEECRKMGICRVLMTCNESNPASARTIEKNGGVLIDSPDFGGQIVRRYRIDLAPSDELRLTAIKYGQTKLPESWIFDGGDDSVIYPISLLFFLIEKGERKILVDVGCDTMPGFELVLHESPVHSLEKLLIAPDDIDTVVLSHSHGDHIDCLHYYKNASVIIQSDEARDGRGYLPKNPDGTSSERVICFEDEYRIDDEIAIRRIGGHSIGSSAVILSVGGEEYVLVGDEFYHPLCIEKNRTTGRAYNTAKNAEFLAYCRENHRKTVIFHDYAYLPDELGSVRII